MLQMGKLIRRIRKEQKITQKELAEGIVSESVMSRIETGAAEPDFETLHALFRRLGKSLEPFEIIVSNREFDEWKEKAKTVKINTILIAEGEYFRDIREAMGLSQEKFCADIYARETISNIEHGRAPHRNKIRNVLERQGMEFAKYYADVTTTEYNIFELVQQYQKMITVDVSRAKEMLLKISRLLDNTDSVNRQFLESSRLRQKRREGLITSGEELAGLEKCLRYTMSEYDGMIYRIPHRQEKIILEEIVWCMEQLQRKEAAMSLAEEIEKKEAKKLKLS